MGPEASIAEALALVRREELATALATTVFVCRPPLETPTGRYLGMVHIQRCCASHPMRRSAASSTRTSSRSLPMSLGQITRMLANYNMVGLPVVDDESGALLGAVTVDDVLDHILPRTGARTGTSRTRSTPRWLMAERRSERLDQPRENVRRFTLPSWMTNEAFGLISREVRPLHGDRAVPHRHDGLRRDLADLEHVGTQEPPVDPRDLNYTPAHADPQSPGSYAAPLILLAQNRQADRDRVATEQDRSRDERNLADTEFLTREVAALRLALRETATRDFVRSELRDLLWTNSRNVGCGSPPIRRLPSPRNPWGKPRRRPRLVGMSVVPGSPRSRPRHRRRPGDPQADHRARHGRGVHLRRGRTGRRDHPAHRLRLPLGDKLTKDTTAALMKVEGCRLGRGHPRGHVGRAARELKTKLRAAPPSVKSPSPRRVPSPGCMPWPRARGRRQVVGDRQPRGCPGRRGLEGGRGRRRHLWLLDPRMLGVEGKFDPGRRHDPAAGAHDVKVISIGMFVPGNQRRSWRGPMLHRALQQFLADVFWGRPRRAAPRPAARDRRCRDLGRPVHPGRRDHRRHDTPAGGGGGG